MGLKYKNKKEWWSKERKKNKTGEFIIVYLKRKNILVKKKKKENGFFVKIENSTDDFPNSKIDEPLDKNGGSLAPLPIVSPVNPQIFLKQKMGKTALSNSSSLNRKKFPFFFYLLTHLTSANFDHSSKYFGDNYTDDFEDTLKIINHCACGFSKIRKKEQRRTSIEILFFFCFF